MRFKADLVLLMVAVIWGTGFVAQGVAASYGSAYLYNGACFVLGSVLLLPILLRRKQEQRPVISAGQWRWMAVAGIVLSLSTILQQVGLLYTRIANAGFLTSLYTVFTPFLLWLGFRERPHWFDAAAVLMAAVGAYLLSTGGSFQMQPGDSLELLGAFFAAIHFVIIGKFATRYDPVSFSAGHFMIAGAFSLMVGLLFEQPAQLLPLPMIGAIVYRGVMTVVVGYTLQIWGQRHTAPTDAAIILALESVFALIFAWLILSQKLDAVQIAGCGVILAAVMISQLKGAFLSRAAGIG